MRGAWLTAAVLALVPISALAQTPTGTPVTIQSLANRVASQIQANSFAGVNLEAGAVSPSDTGTQDTIANSISGRLLKSANLADLTNPATARVNLGLGALAQLGVGSGLTSVGGNLSANVTTVAGRSGAVTLGTGDVSGLGALSTLSAGSGLTSSGGALSVTYGTASGTAAQGNDSRITGALQAASVPLSALLGGTGGGVTGVTVGSGLSMAAGSLSANVTTVAGRSGAVTLGSGDVSGLAPSATTDTTNAANITSGTLGAARLPAPTATSLGGVQSIAGVSHQWVNSISTSGAPSLSQPSVADVSGAAPLASPTFTGSVTLPSWTTAPSNAAGVVGFNSTTGRYEFGIGGSTATHVRLSGDTMAGPLTVPGVTNTGSETVSGTLTVGPGGSGTGDILQSGTGNLRFSLGGSSSILNFRSSGGTSLLQIGGSLNNIAPQQTVNLTCCTTWSGGSAQGMASILMNSAYTGATTGSTELAPVLLQMASDNVAATSGVPVLYINHNFGGAAMTNGRFAIDAQNTLTAPTGNTSGSGGSYTAIRSTMIAQANDNGTGITQATAKGAIFGLNAVGHLTAAATFYAGVVGAELDALIESGGSALDKIGEQIVEVTPDAVQGSRDDIALSLNNQGKMGVNAVGWNVGISFGRQGGFWPMATGATLIKSIANVTGDATLQAAHGIDWSNVTFTSDSLKLPGFTVDGSGNINPNADTVINGTVFGAAATAGFFHLPAQSAAPTGTPANTTGVPCAVNTATGNLNCYYGSAWHHAAFSAGAG